MLICEIFVNGTPTYVITDNTQKMSAALTGSEVNQLLSFYYVRNFHVVVQILNNILDACKLGKADNFQQIFTEFTTRKQITFQNLVIGLMTDGDFE